LSSQTEKKTESETDHAKKSPHFLPMSTEDLKPPLTVESSDVSSIGPVRTTVDGEIVPEGAIVIRLSKIERLKAEYHYLTRKKNDTWQKQYNNTIEARIGGGGEKVVRFCGDYGDYGEQNNNDKNNNHKNKIEEHNGEDLVKVYSYGNHVMEFDSSHIQHISLQEQLYHYIRTGNFKKMVKFWREKKNTIIFSRNCKKKSQGNNFGRDI